MNLRVSKGEERVEQLKKIVIGFSETENPLHPLEYWDRLPLEVCVRLFYVRLVLCVGSGLATV
jgi:hypothetical protein